MKTPSSAGQGLPTLCESGRLHFLENLRNSRPIPYICTIGYRNQSNVGRAQGKKWTQKTCWEANP
jgi:hypothetical protein